MSNPLTDRLYYSTKFTNLSLVPNCNNSEDGSLEVFGNIYTNYINKYNTSSPGIYIENVLLTSGIINVPQNVNITGGLIVGNTSQFNGIVYINNTTDSTNLTDGGPVTIFGGLSVAKTLRSNIILTNFITTPNILVTNLTTTNLNVNIGRFSFVSTTSLFSNFATVGNLFSSTNTFGSLRITNTTLSSNVSVGSLIINGGLSIQSTQTGTSSSSGNSLTIAGGLGVIKDSYIGNSLFVRNIDMTPSTGDFFRERTFVLNNNVSIPTDITELLFNNSITRYFFAFLSVHITTSTTELYSGHELKGIKNITKGWIINSTFIGDTSTNIKFTITSSGQVRYTSSNIINWVSGTLNWRSLSINL